jgi:hypothetical protein
MLNKHANKKNNTIKKSKKNQIFVLKSSYTFFSHRNILSMTLIFYFFNDLIENLDV